MMLNKFKTGIKMLVIGTLISIGLSNLAHAQQADTSLDDIEFTEIVPDTNVVADTAVVSSVVSKDSSAVSSDVSSDDKPGAKTVASAEREKTLWETFIAGLAGGFLAFLMPCIFPMVPLTISYFTKRAGSRQKGIGQALIYGLSIIVIYVAFGLLITLIFGSSGLNAFSSSGTFNFFFFLLLVVFAV
uniref:cytochrome c biogenesis protein CcdA n=1 Tax=Pedobacter ginsengisoli TaxID=363852 RepID=UPI0032B7F383